MTASSREVPYRTALSRLTRLFASFLSHVVLEIFIISS